MKIKFKNYTYFDPYYKGNDNGYYDVSNGTGKDKEFLNKFAFDEKQYNNMIAKRNFQGAYDYMSKFHLNDPKKDKERRNTLIDFKRSMRREEYIYNTVRNTETTLSRVLGNAKYKTRDILDFQANINDLSVFAKNDINNDFYKSFSNELTSLGSTDKQQASKLEFVFEPEKQYFLGIDWLAKDNTENSIEAFFKRSGLTEAQINSTKTAQVIDKGDGRKSIVFDKNNPLALQILKNVPTPKHRTIYGTVDVDLDDDNSYNAILHSYDDNNNLISTSKDSWGIVQAMLKDTEDISNQVYDNANVSNKTYSSVVGGSLSDEYDAIQTALAEGTISQSEFNRLSKSIGIDLREMVSVIGTGAYQMWSNSENEDMGDETLREVPNDKRNYLRQLISATDPKDIKLNSMISNNEIGTLISIPAIQKSNTKMDDDSSPEERLAQREIQIFVPGLFTELAQQKINNNISLRAYQELEDMDTYKYKYKTNDGREFTAHNGICYEDGKEVSRAEVLEYIAKDYKINEAIDNIVYNNVNSNNIIFDENNADKEAKIRAIQIANDIVPNISFGNGVTIDDVFNKKGAGDTLSAKEDMNMQYERAYKYNLVYEIYNRILNGITQYNQ
uniref:Uncharacterized protein n=1 Tax=Geladintestivirus 2 TaxID=3233134 RepID=A0AAU8MGN1_9CAUD